MSKRARRRYWLAAWIAAWLALGFPTAANAYIDPATTSYLIQVVSGVVISLSVAIGVFFRRIVLFCMTFRARTAATWVILTSPNRVELWRAARQAKAADKARQAQAAQRLLEAQAEATKSGATPRVVGATVAAQRLAAARRPLRFRRRLAIALLTGFAPAFMTICFGFLDLFQHNPGEFPFTYRDVLWPALFCSVAVGLAIAGLLLVLRGRGFEIAVSLVLGLTLAAWVQASFMNGGYGALTGEEVRPHRAALTMTVNTLVWLVLLALPWLLWRVNRPAWRVVAWMFPALVLAGGTVSLLLTSSDSLFGAAPKDDGKALTYQGAFEVSSTANQYIFLLDMMDWQFVQDIVAEDPDFFSSQLDGFTQFDNFIANHNHTFPSEVAILTGQEFDYSYPVEEYYARAYRDSTFLPALRAAGYSTNLYATNRYAYHEIEDVEWLADNVNQVAIDTDHWGILKGMSKLAAFRYAPGLAKPAIWFTPEDFGRAPTLSDQPIPFTNDAAVDNIAFHTRMEANGLTVGSAQPRFMYFHLYGAHTPAMMNAQIEAVPRGSVSLVEQAKGAFQIVFDYIAELKRLGVYEDATIVITADHGEFFSPPLETPHLSALFVKPAGAAGTPLAYSDAPTQPSNIRATLLADAGLANPEGVPTVFELASDAAVVRDFWFRPDREDYQEHWQVIGDARDFANWHYVDRMETHFEP
ncbi:MAG: sulfatase-like hydrolase/transferase [Bifidobacteriaceae bacterium]|jgi:hypothetical protein|nr:sulfatase-like hydrolase/transferase [Bifidobacteriaceae bacterium]